LAREGLSFGAMLAQLNFRLRTRDLVPWSRWITPRVPAMMNRRFDTRFFVTTVPEGQVAGHDNYEATESIWLTPREALRHYWDGRIAFAPPQIMSMSHLSRHATVQSVLDEAKGWRWQRRIEPERFEEAGERFLCYPGDERHSVRERALPGPTRMRVGQTRFEPPDGFEAWFT